MSEKDLGVMLKYNGEINETNPKSLQTSTKQTIRSSRNSSRVKMRTGGNNDAIAMKRVTSTPSKRNNLNKNRSTSKNNGLV